jgi:hypothetical protein
MYLPERTKAMETPWGTAQHVRDLGGGVLSISTGSHGGLFIPKTAARLIPKRVRDAFVENGQGTRDGGIWAEEDLEMAVAIAFLFDHLDNHALVSEFSERVADREYWVRRTTQIANDYPRYRPALKFLKSA